MFTAHVDLQPIHTLQELNQRIEAEKASSKKKTSKKQQAATSDATSNSSLALSTLHTSMTHCLSLDPTVFINPVIHYRSPTQNYNYEGCLSIPDHTGYLPRSNSLYVSYLSRTGEWCHGYLPEFSARIFAHEYDHLDGVLYVDHITQLHHFHTVEQFSEMMQRQQRLQQHQEKLQSYA